MLTLQRRGTRAIQRHDRKRQVLHFYWDKIIDGFQTVMKNGKGDDIKKYYGTRLHLIEAEYKHDAIESYIKDQEDAYFDDLARVNAFLAQQQDDYLRSVVRTFKSFCHKSVHERRVDYERLLVSNIVARTMYQYRTQVGIQISLEK